MKEYKPTIKIEYTYGLEEFVHKEISEKTDLEIKKDWDYFLIGEFPENISKLLSLKSVNNIAVYFASPVMNPKYLSSNLNVLSELLDLVPDLNTFRTFRIDCVGDQSVEVSRLKEFISKRYKLTENADADLLINIGKNAQLGWHIAARLTKRPLSHRPWRVESFRGVMSSPVAYCMNVMSDMNENDRYLNVFSGSGTLLIERTDSKYLELVGFDNDGLHNSYAIKNIKKAGLIKKIKIMKEDLLNKPDLGKFTVITADLPFGIAFGKNSNLESLYSQFVDYALESLTKKGRVLVYTSNTEAMDSVLLRKKIKPTKRLDLVQNDKKGGTIETSIYLIKNR